MAHPIFGSAHPETSLTALEVAFDGVAARVRLTVHRSRVLHERSQRLCRTARQIHRPRIRGGSDGELTRTERTIDKLRRGALPAYGPAKMWIGPGSSRKCNGCGESITDQEQEFELEVSTVISFRFHAECHQAWMAFGDGIQGRPPVR